MAVLSTDLDGALQRRRQRRDQGRPALPRPPDGQIRKEEVAVLPRFFFFCFFLLPKWLESISALPSLNFCFPVITSFGYFKMVFRYLTERPIYFFYLSSS